MTNQSVLSPDLVAAETLEIIRAKANADRAASYQRYFKERVFYYGLDNKGAKQIKQDLLDRVKGSWTIQDTVEFCTKMVEDPHMEARGIGYQIVASFISEASPELLTCVKHWLEHFCGNWGLVDNLAPSVLAPLVEMYEGLIPEVISWSASPNQWVRRGAVVAFVPLVRKNKTYQEAAYEIVSRLLDDNEDLIHKAIGWLLREAGKIDTQRLEEYLLKNGPKIPRTSVRYAIELFPKERRKHFLEATKGEKIKRAG